MQYSSRTATPGGGEWLVARVCSDYIHYCERGLANGTISQSHRNSSVSFLNDLCTYCGALPVTQLKKGHIQTWIERHKTWRSIITVGSGVSTTKIRSGRPSAVASRTSRQGRPARR